MIGILKNSFLWKAAAQLRSWAEKSVLHSLSAFFKRSYSRSLTKTIFARFCEVPNRAHGSVYGRICSRVSARISMLAPAVSGSIVFRLLRALLSFITRLVQNSRLAFLAKVCTIRRLILLSLVLSVCVDYFFRNVITVTVIASAWDEALILAALSYVIYRRASSRLPKPCRTTPVDSYLLLFIGVGFFLMCVVSPYPGVAFAGYRAVVEYMVWFFLVVRLIDNDGDVMAFYGAMVLLSLLMALLRDLSVHRSRADSRGLGLPNRGRRAHKGLFDHRKPQYPGLVFRADGADGGGPCLLF